MSSGQPLESVPACEYEKEKKKKKKPECREVVVEIIASSYCRRALPEYFSTSKWLSRVPRTYYTNTREQMTVGSP